MALFTRLKAGVEGLDGFNIYDKEDNYIGEIKVVEINKEAVRVMVDAPALKIVPKKVDKK